MVKTHEKASAQELADFCMAMADDRKAGNILSLQTDKTAMPVDFCIICTGNSEPHLQAIADRIAREVKTKFGFRPAGSEGTSASHWMLLDYGSVVVHIMTAEMRDLYQLESLWGDAPRREAVQVLARGPVAEK